MKKLVFISVGFIVISLILSLDIKMYCTDNSFITITYSKIPKDVLDKTKLNKLETYLKSPGDNRGFEAIGLLGNKDTVIQLEKWLKSTMRTKIRFSMIFSLIMLGERNHIQELLMGLNRKLPEYDRWLKEEDIPLNSNTHCASLLRKLSEYEIRFDAEHIDKLVQALDHPHSSVVSDVRFALNQIFGIWFVESEDWVHKPLNIREKYVKAWKRYWKENRSRYVNKKPIIINNCESKNKSR